MSKIRTRIAPSPTGPLHVGTARTALFNYLFAKKNGGKFILRVEDTDLERSDKKYEKDIFEGLSWLGIEADESPEKGGSYGPYRQSERIHTYKKYIEKLLAEGKAFYCFHSEKELAEEKEKLLETKKPPLHLCEYRTLDPRDAKILAKTKLDHVIRFKTPLGRKITFQDTVRGEVSFESDLVGDFSIARKIDSSLYHLAVVIDDEEMEITHVIRGEDHIANTPKHILLIEALGFRPVIYAHIPLILGPDRSKLSKRHGATSVGEYREAGFLPEALFNFMALLGWNPGDNQEIFSKEELIEKFSIEKVQKSGAVFDITKLEWMSGEYIRNTPIRKLIKLSKPFFPKNKKGDDYLQKVLVLEQPRLKKLSELEEKTDYFFAEPIYDKELLRWKDMKDDEIIQSLNISLKLLQKIDSVEKAELEKTFLNEIGAGDKGRILWPLRVALSGKKASPGPFEIMEVLGIEESKKRLKTAKNKLSMR